MSTVAAFPAAAITHLGIYLYTHTLQEENLFQSVRAYKLMLSLYAFD